MIENQSVKLGEFQRMIAQLDLFRTLLPGNAEIEVWFDDLQHLVIEICGADSEEYYAIMKATFLQGNHVGSPGEPREYIAYRVKLQQIETACKIVLNRLQKGRGPTPRLGNGQGSKAPQGQSQKIFVSHGPPGLPLGKLKDFLVALGTEPIVVEEQPAQGRSVVSNVDKYASDCSSAIVLATRDRSIDDGWEPSAGVLIEIGDLRQRFAGKVIYLVESGVERASMWAEHVYIGFTSECMDDAFTRLARELRVSDLVGPS